MPRKTFQEKRSCVKKKLQNRKHQPGVRQPNRDVMGKT